MKLFLLHIGLPLDVVRIVLYIITIIIIFIDCSSMDVTNSGPRYILSLFGNGHKCVNYATSGRTIKCVTIPHSLVSGFLLVRLTQT